MLDLTGKIIAILGAGRSGRAAARLVARCGGVATIYDASPADGAIQITPGEARNITSDLVIVSPGIETGGDFVQAFAQNSGDLWAEVELAWRCYDGKTIGITGTNGKTTTTELVRDLVEATGVSCVACGNYGVPLSEVVLYAEVPAAIALELSSFQLETIRDFRPDAVIWLNFSADHMDRYHSLEEYRAAKLRILENITPETLVVVRKGENLPAKGHQVEFSAVEPAAWTLREGVIECDGEPFLAMHETRLRGLHNAENLMAACAVVEGLTPEIARRALAKYSPPEHRCELVAIMDGVEYLNDSKATNLHALESALRSQTRPTILLAGGKQKGLDYQSLGPLLQEKVKKMICYGEIGPILAVTFFDLISCETVGTLEQAVAAAISSAQTGDTVLLSPGTSSFDQFSGYEARGKAFKSAVQRLNKIQ